MSVNGRDRTHGLGERILLWVIPVVGALFALSSVAIFAAESEQGVFVDEDTHLSLPKAKERWGFAYENDFFVPGGRDQDYTFGLALSYSSAELKQSIWHQPLTVFDRILGFDRQVDRQGFETGFYGFTPADKLSGALNVNDRPFSSLVYVATSQERFNPSDQSVVRTQISYGVLGLDLVGEVQEEFHALIGNDQPKGWDNQISDGGELTFRYSLSKQSLIGEPSNRFELRHTRAASVGYMTEASWGLSFRAGRLNSSWRDFNPDIASYAESSASAQKGNGESFFWAGAVIKVRGYNAFLQGQFKDSAHHYNRDDLRHIIFEAWAGYTRSFTNGYFVSYGLRGHSSEVEVGEANRNVIWGGLMIGRTLF